MCYLLGVKNLKKLKQKKEKAGGYQLPGYFKDKLGSIVNFTIIEDDIDMCITKMREILTNHTIGQWSCWALVKKVIYF